MNMTATKNVSTDWTTPAASMPQSGVGQSCNGASNERAETRKHHALIVDWRATPLSLLGSRWQPLLGAADGAVSVESFD